MFENASEQSKVNNKKEKFFAPPKPPRVAAPEINPEEDQPKDEQQATKRKAPSPPREKSGSTEMKNDTKPVDDKPTSVIKRKAPEPPSHDKNKVNIKTSESASRMECEQGEIKARIASSRSTSTEEVDGSTAPVPAKRERKGSVEQLDGISTIKGDQPTPTPRRKGQSSSEANNITTVENVSGSENEPESAEANTTVTIVATPIDDHKNTSKTDKTKQRPQEEPCIIQACVVEESTPEITAKSVSSKNTVTVQAVSCSGSEAKSKSRKSERTKVTSVDETEKHPRKANKAEKNSDGMITAVPTKRNPSSSSRKTRELTKKEEFAFKVPKQPAARDNCHFDLNETVNLNDVNIHEMTFNFDFSQFDQELEKEKDSIFVSYEEKCKQVCMFCQLPFWTYHESFLLSNSADYTCWIGLVWARWTLPPGAKYPPCNSTGMRPLLSVAPCPASVKCIGSVCFIQCLLAPLSSSAEASCSHTLTARLGKMHEGWIEKKKVKHTGNSAPPFSLSVLFTNRSLCGGASCQHCTFTAQLHLLEYCVNL